MGNDMGNVDAPIGHGGDLIAASNRYGIAPEKWIDLSTGINPNPYPVAALDPRAFQRLPYLLPELMQKAGTFYGNGSLLPVSGTQSVIQTLPHCLPARPVLLPDLGYREHALRWRRAGVPVSGYPAREMAAACAAIEAALERDNCQHLVVINPNNPTGLRFAPEQLLNWAERLAPGAHLIVDEAFMDLTPHQSVLSTGTAENMVVMRSFGKFFGLAGIRLGFVFAAPALLDGLQRNIGLWTVNGPAQAIAIEALADVAWQAQARLDINRSGRVTRRVFAPLWQRFPCHRTVHEHLFSSYWMAAEDAHNITRFFARSGILLRLIKVDAQAALVRIGLLNRKQKNVVAKVNQAVFACMENLCQSV
ncbi:MAG: pyridoxal phosphate-dependent class II aminotransferase [Exilibacterium sp.]